MFVGPRNRACSTPLLLTTTAVRRRRRNSELLLPTHSRFDALLNSYRQERACVDLADNMGVNTIERRSLERCALGGGEVGCRTRNMCGVCLVFPQFLAVCSLGESIPEGCQCVLWQQDISNNTVNTAPDDF